MPNIALAIHLQASTTDEDMKPKDALSHYGTQLALADALNLKQSSIAKWVKSGAIPQLRQLQIESITNGKLKADKTILKGKK